MSAHAFGFENSTVAASYDRALSSNFRSLNGDWRFHWVQDPRQRPLDFFRSDFDDSEWADFPVPANWETNGYGLPIYVNHPYEFTGRAKMGAALDPPYDIPKDNNPVGSYRKIVEIPENWNGKQIFIHLGAVKSAFFIWVNGEQVGYSTDSKLAAEFDITPYVKPGKNLVALQVYRWSSGSYLECQDMWRISGIERDVYLYATPKLNIRDFRVEAALDQNYRHGIFTLDAEIRSYKTDRNALTSKADTFSVSIQLHDADGKTVFNKRTSDTPSVLGRYRKNISFAAEVPDVNQWSAEKPYLYTLYISLEDKEGTVIQVVPVKVGFRTIEIKDANVLVNGKRVFFKGVNRHEHHPFNGHALSRSDMEKDMEMMKKLNVNAVRHSHYPPDPYWLELCDKYGLYVVDEANIESHGRYYDLEYTLGNDPKWRDAHLSRIYRMYDRDKNFPSVLKWSLGNEAGNGINFYEAYDGLKERDTRPVQYERALSEYNTDILVPQYPSPLGLKHFSQQPQTRPLIMSEYAHIMGNSLGNFKDYWDVIEANPYLQGGFVWEWIDQGLDTIKNDKRILAYGGDFPLEGPVDQNITDNNFSIKGVVTAHRELTPMAIELKKVHQFIKTEYRPEKTIKIRNTYFFRDLTNVGATWILLEAGKPIESGELPSLDIPPGDSAVFSLPIKATIADTSKEYLLNVSYRLKSAEPFLPAAYEIAYEQFALSAPAPFLTSHRQDGQLKLEQTETTVNISGKTFHVLFDPVAGKLVSYRHQGEDLIVDGPKPSFWRAPTDNDIGARYNERLRSWRDAGETGKVLSFTVKPDGKNYEITIQKSLLEGDAETTQTFLVENDGSIWVTNDFKAIKGDHKILLRYGNNLAMNPAFDQIRFYGRGPWENYIDRKSASLVGIYQQTVDEQYFTYARPQESGNKSDVRWVEFTNPKGKGLRFEYVDSLLSFSALPYHLDDLDPEMEKKQYHSGELEKRDRIYLHIDGWQSGVQGIDSWGAQPLAQYRIPFTDYRYQYRIKPIE